ncbi:hypothetical protein FBULB1_92 [Fusarium bulbicola]|nr:hypothetical protein FBULB1_92 [Fusarium bulbicola]
MATGLEALGAACALVQLIQFSFKTVAGCKKVYDGEPTDHNVLSAYVHDMHENLVLVEKRFQSLDISEKSPPGEKELQTVAIRCQDTVRELQTELSYVIEKQEKGDCASAIRYMFRSLMRRGKIERLRRSLDMERGLMENRLLMLVCSQNDAKDLLDDHRFMSLDNHIKSMIILMSKGHYKLEALISMEHRITRDIIVQESANTRETVKSFITTESQRKEFLESLRFPEMKKRYNDLKGSGEVSFDRVFASYESMSSSEVADRFNEATAKSSKAGAPTDMFLRGIEDDRDIDSTWSVFKQWLTTSHPLFCIQGKPGSGKSTLSKFIIDNPNTVSLLAQWSTKSGHPIKTQHHHVLIFVDGVDEIGNSDGIPNLIQIIEELFSFPQIKICVSSRPDLSVTGWLKKHNANHILLEDLTNYEMARFSLRELESFASSDRISLVASQRFTRIIVERSKGVFLWVYLVLRSVTIGIRNGDPEELLLERLEALPSELGDLYSEMWRRMGEHSHLYQKVAAKYFHYTLHGSYGPVHLVRGPSRFQRPSLTLLTPSVLQIVCAENPRFQEFLLGPKTDEEYKVLEELYQETKERIEHKCAGLLQICAPPISQSAFSVVRAATV